MSKNKTGGLGRGLGALIPGAGTSAESGRREPHVMLAEEELVPNASVAPLPIASIVANPFQPRKDFPEEALAELTESIREHGVIQPVTVRKRPQGGFELVAGERRLRASQRAGLKEVPAYVLEVDDRHMLEMAIVENVQRLQLNPIEEAEAYQRLIAECGLTQEEVAEKIAKDRTTIANTLRLLKLPESVRDSLRKGELGIGHAKAIMALSEPEAQLRMWARAKSEHLSVRRLEEEVRKLTREDRSLPDRPANPHPASAQTSPHQPRTLDAGVMEDLLKRRLGTQIRIRMKSDGTGEIGIEFYSSDDLNRLTELLIEIEPS